MSRHDTVQGLALHYFRNCGMDLDSAILRAASELELAGKLKSDADERPGRLWTPPVRKCGYDRGRNAE